MFKLRYFSLLLLLFIVGCTVHPSSSSRITNEVPIKTADTRLGTQWGEGIQNSVQKVDLKRIDKSPISTIEISYSSTYLTGTTLKEVLLANGRIGLSILNDKGQKMPLKQQGSQIHLQGKIGERYQLSYHSYNKNNLYEIIATVDGLDVLNGTAGSFKNAGYVLYPERTLTIKGFRKNSDEVAAFRFSGVNDTYAANTDAGDVRNIGIIGTAVFRLIDPTKPAITPIQRPRPNAFPNESGYAPEPRYSH